MRALDGKVSLITGSSRGIGAAIAKRFAAGGARVAVHGRDAAALAAMQDEIRRAGGQAMLVTADVTRAVEVEAMRRRIEEELGPIDILVANAGGNPVPPGPLDAAAALFLASEESGWTTGIILDIAGGPVMT
jgi:3-oxoacyl-[acyl-carrier protein] reductase